MLGSWLGDPERTPPLAHAVDRSRLTMKKALAVLALLLAAGAYLYYDAGLRALLFEGTPLAPAPAVTHVYKWRDAEGQWQITDRPPPAGFPYEALEYREDVNVMPLVPRGED